MRRLRLGLATRIALIAAVFMLLLAGGLLLREASHEARLEAQIAGLLQEGARNTWAGFVHEATGRLNDADLLLRSDPVLTGSGRTTAELQQRFAEITAPFLAANPEFRAAFVAPSDPHRGDGVYPTPGGAVLVHAVVLPTGVVQFSQPIERLMQAVAATLRATLRLSPRGEGPAMADILRGGRRLFIVRFPLDEAAAFDIEVAWDYTESAAAAAARDGQAGVLLAAGVLAALLLMQAYMRRALRPLAAAVVQLRDLAAGDLAAPDPASSGQRDEVGTLVGTLEAFRIAMADQRRLAGLQEELAAAQRIQAAMLPAGGLQLAAVTVEAAIRPAREIGGDFYGHHVAADGSIAVVVADVSGKGLAAALTMAQASFVLRSAAGPDGPAAMLTRANALLAADNPHLVFTTAVAAVLHPATGRLLVSSAGHPPPLLVAADGQVTQVALRPGRPLGLFAATRYREVELELRPGERLVLFSDGLSDAEAPGGAMAGLQGVAVLAAAALRRGGGAASVLAEVDRFAAGAPQADDMTCLVLAMAS